MTPRHAACPPGVYERSRSRDRKSTRLNSSHSQISYAVFSLKKKAAATLLQHPFQKTEQNSLLTLSLWRSRWLHNSNPWHDSGPALTSTVTAQSFLHHHYTAG